MNTNVQDGGGNQFYFTLEHVEGINHVVVFLTGNVPFSDGFGGSIFFGWPSSEGGISWQLLGFISNQKPSAIFRISNVKPSISDVNPFGASMMATLGSISSTTALIGISVEPLDQIAQQTPASNTQASTVDSFTEFSQKMLQSFFNYASSFAVTPLMMSQMPINPMENYVPLNSVQNWYDSFVRRMQADPSYWKNL